MGAKIKPGIEIKSSVMQCAKAGRGMGRHLFLNENFLQTDNRSHRKEEIIIVSCLCTVELLHYYVPDTDVFFLDSVNATPSDIIQIYLKHHSR